MKAAGVSSSLCNFCSFSLLSFLTYKPVATFSLVAKAGLLPDMNKVFCAACSASLLELFKKSMIYFLQPTIIAMYRISEKYIEMKVL